MVKLLAALTWHPAWKIVASDFSHLFFPLAMSESGECAIRMMVKKTQTRLNTKGCALCVFRCMCGRNTCTRVHQNKHFVLSYKRQKLFANEMREITANPIAHCVPIIYGNDTNKLEIPIQQIFAVCVHSYWWNNGVSEMRVKFKSKGYYTLGELEFSWCTHKSVCYTCRLVHGSGRWRKLIYDFIINVSIIITSLIRVKQ